MTWREKLSTVVEVIFPETWEYVKLQNTDHIIIYKGSSQDSSKKKNKRFSCAQREHWAIYHVSSLCSKTHAGSYSELYIV